MASRVIEAGTIVARTQQLLRCGVLVQRPLWLDVVEALPSLLPPQYNRPPDPGRPSRIAFPEDKLRRYFYRKCECVTAEDEVISLDETASEEESVCERFVREVQSRLVRGDELLSASQKAVWALKSSGVAIKLRTSGGAHGVRDGEEEEEGRAADQQEVRRLTDLLHTLKHVQKLPTSLKPEDKK